MPTSPLLTEHSVGEMLVRIDLHYRHTNWRLPDPTDPDDKWEWDELVKDWLHTLGHLRVSKVQQAYRAHRSDPEKGRFAPNPADLLFALERVARENREKREVKENQKTREKIGDWKKTKASKETVAQCMEEVRSSAWFKRGKAWSSSQTKPLDEHSPPENSGA